MKEQDLIALGFEKRICDEDGQDWYYYTYSFAEHLKLISCDSEEAESKRIAEEEIQKQMRETLEKLQRHQKQ